MNTITITTLSLLLLILSTVFQIPKSTPNPGNAAIGSPTGDVPFGAKIYSPNGKLYACEVEPKDQGKIGIYDRNTDKKLKTIDVKQHPENRSNPLKGLAFSPDSKFVAAIYHHDAGGHISIVDVEAGKQIKYLPITKYYHYAEFSSDGTKIKAGSDLLDIK